MDTCAAPSGPIRSLTETSCSETLAENSKRLCTDSCNTRAFKVPPSSRSCSSSVEDIIGSPNKIRPSSVLNRISLSNDISEGALGTCTVGSMTRETKWGRLRNNARVVLPLPRSISPLSTCPGSFIQERLIYSLGCWGKSDRLHRWWITHLDLGKVGVRVVAPFPVRTRCTSVAPPRNALVVLSRSVALQPVIYCDRCHWKVL
jgi:hypothetical protein